MKLNPRKCGGRENGIEYTVFARPGTKYLSLNYVDPASGKRCRPSTPALTLDEAHVYAKEFFKSYISGSNGRTLTVGDIVSEFLRTKQASQPRDHVECERAWKRRLEPKFATIDHRQLTRSVLIDYKLWAIGTKPTASSTPLFRSWAPIERPLSKGTVNRDLAFIVAAYNNCDGVTYRPTTKRLKFAADELVVRQGFLEQAEFDRIMALTWLPLWLRGFLLIAYENANRRAELISLTVGQVDFFSRTIRLWEGETKSGDGRLVGMSQEAYEVLVACCQGKNHDEPVFAREDRKLGRREVGDFRKLWVRVLRSAGIERRILIHDFRRSAVSNMITRDGMSVAEAMSVSGHKTPSMVDRYTIINKSTLTRRIEALEAGKKLAREQAAIISQTDAVAAQNNATSKNPSQFGHSFEVSEVAPDSQVVVN